MLQISYTNAKAAHSKRDALIQTYTILILGSMEQCPYLMEAPTDYIHGLR